MVYFFLLLDFLVHIIFHISIVYSLRIYIIASLLLYEKTRGWKILALGGLIVQDSFLSARFGLCVIWIVPLIYLVILSKQHIDDFFRPFFVYLLVVFADLFEIIIIKRMILWQQFPLKSTGWQILITIGVTSLILLSMRGNRFLLMAARRGKSGLQAGRMPYEMDYGILTSKGSESSWKVPQK